MAIDYYGKINYVSCFDMLSANSFKSLIHVIIVCFHHDHVSVTFIALVETLSIFDRGSSTVHVIHSIITRLFVT